MSFEGSLERNYVDKTLLRREIKNFMLKEIFDALIREFKVQVPKLNESSGIFQLFSDS